MSIKRALAVLDVCVISLRESTTPEVHTCARKKAQHPTISGHTTIPDPKKDLGKGLVHKIMKQAGLKMKFTIAIEPGAKKTAFGVAVPDLPGCFSAGDTVEEAFDNAREAIEAHCEVLAEEGKELPRPKPMSEWQKDREYKGWTWGIVDVPAWRRDGYRAAVSFRASHIRININDHKPGI